MSQQTSANIQPSERISTSTTTITKLAYYIHDAYDVALQKFRFQVPQLDILRLRAATSGNDITQAVEATKSPSGFVLFAEFNHAGWMRHFAVQGATVPRAHRFTFGNPLYALPVLSRNIEAALYIPLDCCFIEELDGERTKLIVTLPTTWLGDISNDGAGSALVELEGKLKALVERLAS